MVRRTRHFSYRENRARNYKLLDGWYLNIDIESLGDWSDRGTPGHIPNPLVKPVSADGTWWVTAWESRSLPRDFMI